jgi:hypothetical protein
MKSVLVSLQRMNFNVIEIRIFAKNEVGKYNEMHVFTPFVTVRWFEYEFYMIVRRRPIITIKIRSYPVLI